MHLDKNDKKYCRRYVNQIPKQPGIYLLYISLLQKHLISAVSKFLSLLKIIYFAFLFFFFFFFCIHNISWLRIMSKIM